MGAELPAVYLRSAQIDFSWRDAGCNLQELVFNCVRGVLDRSGIEFAEVDGVVLSAHDVVDGRSLSSMVSAPAAGAYLRDEVRLGEDGAVALSLASTRVAAGYSNNCIVAAWGRASEGEPEKIANALFDPFFAQPLGLTEVSISSLRAAGALRLYPGYGSHRAAAAVRPDRVEAAGRRAVGQRPASAPPLRVEETHPAADIVVAAILTTEPTDIRIAGTGMSSEPYWPGDRKLLELPALTEAAGTALGAAGCDLDDLAVVEVDGLTLFDEALALEAIGLAPRGDGMERLAIDSRVNSSGGGAGGYCAPAMGLVRLVAAADALRALGDRAGPRMALATGSSTIAAQTQTAIVLERAA